jgi:two-component system cell cycle response regulator DivK
MQKNKVLIVEDNELNLKLFKDLLELRNVKVCSTKDGGKFHNIALEFMPDLILMDIKLQIISGYDLIKQLKLDQRTKHIPIVAITAFATKSDKENLLKAGCAAYLSKPVSVDHFFEVVEHHLDLENSELFKQLESV